MENKSMFLISPDETELWEHSGDRCPLGLGYLSSYCKNILNLNTKIYDMNHEKKEDLMKDITLINPNYICVSISTPSYLWCIDLVKEIKKVYNGKLIAGGNHITDNPDEKLTIDNFDYIIVGDGEIAIKRIVEGNVLTKIIISEKVNVNEVPWPDYEGMKFERYNFTFEGKKCAMIISSRGCVYGCAFCGSAKIKKWRPRTPEDVVNEMKYLQDNYQIESFYFGDDIFSFDRQRVIDICVLILAKLNIITFRITTRVNLLDEEMLEYLKDSGCRVICLGLESGDDEILRNIRKGATVQHARDAVNMVHRFGMKVKGFFIIGLPGETKQTAMKTIQFAKELKIDYVDFYPYTPYPSTPIWDNPQKFNLEVIKPINSDWNNYFQVDKQGMPREWKVKHPNLTQEDVYELIELGKREVNVTGMTK
ncbi:MAG: radical SAM protein [Nanoarchaeota archaeon]